jgi:hypothetical protein
VPTVRIGRFVYFPKTKLAAWAEQFAKDNPLTR